MIPKLLALCLLPLLGHDSYYVRQGADDALGWLDDASAFRLGVQSGDLEVSTRCRVLITQSRERWLVGRWQHNGTGKCIYEFRADHTGVLRQAAEESIVWILYGDTISIAHSPYFGYFFHRQGDRLDGGSYGILEKIK